MMCDNGNLIYPRRCGSRDFGYSSRSSAQSLVCRLNFLFTRDPWVGLLPQPFAIEDFRITRIKILDYSTESITPRGQQGLHSQVGQIC
jgi:hypothetical protein